MAVFVCLTLLFVLVLKCSPLEVSAERPENASVPYQTELGDEVSSILNSIRQGYDKRVRPNYGGEPVEVGVTMYILSISSLSEVQMDFTVDFYFRQTWKDPRLAFKGPPGISTLSVGSEFLSTIWVPDTFFVNAKKSNFHQTTTPNEFLRISQDGDVLRSTRLTVTASCPMDLRYFPMDNQLCTIQIESYGYTMSDIRYNWAKGLESVGVASDVSLPHFKVLGHRQIARAISLTTGNYSRLACELQFTRSMGYYLIQIYIPATLIVIISWVSFWLNRTSPPARVALSVTTVLTITTLIGSTNAALPKVSYLKAIDVYLVTCFIMVFATLLEYAAVSYIGKHIEMRKNSFRESQKRTEPKETVILHHDVHVPEHVQENPARRTLLPGKDVNTINGITPGDFERRCRVIFPICFTCFSVIYWITYLYISDVVVDDLVILEKSKYDF